MTATKPKFRIMCAILVIFPFVAACAPAHMPKCRHIAVYEAITFGDQSDCPVRIAVGKSTIETEKWHSQAQAFVGGKWEYLEIYDNTYIGVGVRESFDPEAYYSVDDFRRSFIDIKNSGDSNLLSRRPKTEIRKSDFQE